MWSFKGRQASGYTLLELMVGLFLGVLIIGLTLSYLAATSQSFKLSASEGLIHENGRLALNVIADHLRRAGALDTPAKSQASVLYDAGACQNQLPFCAASASGLAASTLGINVRDVDGASYCGGIERSRLKGVSDQLAVVFFVADRDRDGVNSLYCQLVHRADHVAIGRSVPMVEGVDVFSAQAAVDATGDGVVDYYKSTRDTFDESAEHIKAIHVAVLVQAGSLDPSEVAHEPLKRRTYLLPSTPELAFNDSVVRQVFSTTIALPNRYR